MKRLVMGGALAFALILSGVANAQQWYGSIGGGINALRDSDFSDTFPGGSATGTIEFDNGVALSAALGYVVNPNFRVEGELGWKKADLDSITVDTLSGGGVTLTGLGSAPLGGDTTALSFMANGWYDFNTGNKFRPYVGGGIGMAQIKLDVDSFAGIPVSFSDKDWVFAYQVGAGIGYEVATNTVVSLDYRYFGTQDPEFSSGGETLEGEYQSHNVLLSVRFGF